MSNKLTAEEILEKHNGAKYVSKQDALAAMKEYAASLTGSREGGLAWVKASEVENKLHFRIQCGRIIINGIAESYGQFVWDGVEKQWFDSIQRKVERIEFLEILCESAPPVPADQDELWDEIFAGNGGHRRGNSYYKSRYTIIKK